MSDDRATAREWLVRIFERGNRGSFRADERYTGPNWFQLADGERISVVAGSGCYCTPRPGWPGTPEDYSGPFSSVEVWFPGDDEPRGHVTPEELWAYIAAHGGLVAYRVGPVDTGEWIGAA